jgi:branched-chain amino acid transport system substrate-binding protein
MSSQRPDDLLDARLVAYLHERAEDGAARARTPEEVAVEMAPRLRPTYRLGPGATGVVRLAWLVVVVALLLLALLAWFAGGGRLPPRPPVQVVTIAIELPLGGSDPGAASIANAVTLAVSDARGQTGRFRIEIPKSAILSDLVGEVPDAAMGAANMNQIVADPAVVAVIGPFSSFVAQAQIPISDAAGLLQCSPASTDPQLTRTARGATEPAGGRISFIRTVTPDDLAAAGAARYVFERLGATSVVAIDDNQLYGTAMADWFEAEFLRLGGTVALRASLPDSAAAFPALLASARAKDPQAIYFGGSGERGATLRNAAAAAGLGAVPFVGTEALNDGNAATPGSFLQLAGAAARRSYSVFPGWVEGAGRAAFGARYPAAFGADPTPFAAFGYACAQVVVAALQQVDAHPPADGTSFREAVRAAAVDPTKTVQTILGSIAFDANGDVSPRRSTVFAFDATANDWVESDQIDAGADAGG